jgi:hypothetical protein
MQSNDLTVIQSCIIRGLRSKDYQINTQFDLNYKKKLYIFDSLFDVFDSYYGPNTSKKVNFFL